MKKPAPSLSDLLQGGNGFESLEAKLVQAIAAGEEVRLSPNEAYVTLMMQVQGAALWQIMRGAGMYEDVLPAVQAILYPHMDKILPDWRARARPS